MATRKIIKDVILKNPRTRVERKIDEAREKNRTIGTRVARRTYIKLNNTNPQLLTDKQKQHLVGLPVEQSPEDIVSTELKTLLCPRCGHRHSNNITRIMGGYLCIGCKKTYPLPIYGKLRYNGPNALLERIPIENPDWIK
jgi:hypothetical protein